MSWMSLPHVPENARHLLRWSGELTPVDRERLVEDLLALDWNLLEQLSRLPDAPAECIAQADAPRSIVSLAQQSSPDSLTSRARRCGEELLAEGRVGAILVAGGQGSRLGLTSPKGIIPFGPVTRRSLFQWHCEQVLERSRRAGASIPYFVMTSDSTHATTLDFFADQRYFGLNKSDVYFFQQSSLPSLEMATRRPFLADKHRVARSPDGHGGVLKALTRHGLFDVMAERGIEHLYYHQIDNPAAIVCDPLFLGLHWLHLADVSTKVVEKVSPEERMGILAEVDGRPRIIEYSDLSAAQAALRNEDGRLKFWAGNTAIHVFRRVFLQQLVEAGTELPYHVARRPSTSLNAAGKTETSSEPNAFKFEQFIFDVLPLAAKTLIVETTRSREFLPIKEAQGPNSWDSCGQGLMNLWRDWMRAAGVSVEDNSRLEISPSFALDAEDLLSKPLPPSLEDGTVL